MNNFKLRRIALISLSLTGLLHSEGFAATPINLSKQSFPTFLEVRSLAADVKSSPLQIRSSHIDENKVTHLRVQQMHGNYRVFGADAVLHLQAEQGAGFKVSHNNKNLLHFLNGNPQVKKNGKYYLGIEQDLGKTAPVKFNNKDFQMNIIQSFKNDFIKEEQQERWQISHEKAELMVYVNDNQQSRWVYLVSFVASNANTIKQPTAIIDAENRTIYKNWDNVKRHETLQEVKATGYGGNPIAGQWRYGEEKPALSILRDEESQLCYMRNNEVRVHKQIDITEALREKTPGTLFSFECATKETPQDSFEVPEKGYYGQANDAYSPVNDALHIAQTIKNFYSKWYHLDVLKQDNNQALNLTMNIFYLNDGSSFENAFWFPEMQQMYFGLGGRHLYPLVTLGIGAHEVSHGFTEQNSDLNYTDESGSLNESFSDMVIAAISYFDSNKKEVEWSTGSEVIKSNVGKDKERRQAVRYFDEPTRDGYSIDRAEDFKQLQKFCRRVSRNEREFQNCVVHLASGVYNKFFYKFANASGWDPKSAFAVMVKANQDYWTSSETFQTAACGVKSAALDIQKASNKALNLSAIDAAFEEVGISLKDC